MENQVVTYFDASPAQFLEETIKAYIRESPDNCLKDIDGSPIYDEPLVGFVAKIRSEGTVVVNLVTAFALILAKPPDSEPGAQIRPSLWRILGEQRLIRQEPVTKLGCLERL